MTVALKVHGVDLSHHQRFAYDWELIKKSSVKWMYHKSTEGDTLDDTYYKRRREEARKQKFPFGAYHFARPRANDAKLEAKHFIDVARPDPERDLLPALDLETKEYVSGKALVEWADEFCDEVKRRVGVTPLVYTPYILSKELEDAALFWVPRYNNQNDRPFRDWDIWQFSNGIYGVPNSTPGLGHVDLNHSPKVGVKELLIKSQFVPPTSRGRKVDEAMAALAEAKGKGRRGKLIDKAESILEGIDPL